ncbi:ATP phosphoribosyltransferase [Paenibacillus solanacearum]|uniref:ATP phosphoribosyltransferase n=1 Tax=Paenibacillus solanacearum TaxID=2048548 RepID=A0A916K7R0_9BACL|nr:ATP phosphoribosyltransferase [Paenibacillus solanacearum]CAG7651501.1 ATP phosphoribosyltransferase [Paenibacillus solanacearum]
MSNIKCAWPKGSSKEIIRLFQAAGYSLPSDIDESRKYTISGQHIDYILVKPQDVPILVEYGAADIGIAGKDALLEQRREVIELLDLGTNRSRLAVLGASKKQPFHDITVGTGHPQIATAYFAAHKIQANVITLSGNLQTALSSRLADAVVDKVEEEHAAQSSPLHETIMHISDRLIVNRVSYALKYRQIDSICSALSLVL